MTGNMQMWQWHIIKLSMFVETKGCQGDSCQVLNERYKNAVLTVTNSNSKNGSVVNVSVSF